MYLEMHYEVIPHCSSKYNDRNTNCLSRIVTSLILALNTKYYLPSCVIVLLDDNLIEYLGYKRFPVASLLGPWVEYLAQTVIESLESRRQELIPKARLPDKTQAYFVEPVNHDNFEYINQQVRDTFGKCLEVTARLHDNMRILKLRGQTR